MRDADGDHVVGDVRGVLQVMRYRRLREFLSGGAMRIRDGTERGIAHGREVHIDGGVFGDLVSVMEAQSHDEIVRMLRVDNGMAVGGLAGLKQERIALAGDGGGVRG